MKYSASFRISNRVVLKVIIWTFLVQKALILNKMLKIERFNFNFLKSSGAIAPIEPPLTEALS